MKKFKLSVLALTTGTIAFQLFNCARFWGDFVGDAIWLSAID